MAKLTKTLTMRKLNDRIRGMCEGEIYEPLSPENTGEFSPVVASLEELRKTLVEKASEEAEKEARTQETIASVTHDLKTPLALISGYAECIEDGMDDKNYPELIRTKAADMNDTVLKIIDAARTSAGKAKETLKLVDARETLTAIVLKHIPYATEKNISVRVRRIPKVRIAIAERDVDSAIANVISNATKFTPKGGKITISFRKSRKYLFIKIRDTGTGIKAEDMPHIFEKYYTADKARNGSGTGIGLATVKEVMKEHGGNVYCSSKPGKGSVFTLYLPLYLPKSKGLTETERKIIGACFYLVGFPFVVIADFFYIFYLLIKYAYESGSDKNGKKQIAKARREARKKQKAVLKAANSTSSATAENAEKSD